MHTGEKYDVIFIGRALPNYSDSDISRLFKTNYVFLFTTRLNQDKDSSTYGHVNIDLVRHGDLPHFDPHFREFVSYHVLENDPLRINEFLEIIPKETENGIQIIADLKKQNLIGKDHHTVEMVKDFGVLLLRENNGEHYDNYPLLELGSEFQTSLDSAKANKRYYNLHNTFSRLNVISLSNENDLELINAIEVVQEALKKELADAKLIKDRKFKRHIDCRKDLSYILKKSLIELNQ